MQQELTELWYPVSSSRSVEWSAASEHSSGDSQLQEGLGALLYAGVLSCGVGYTLQIVGQKGLNPTVAALIMSLESVIATISGWIAYKIGFLTTDQTLTPRQIAGCVIVFAAVILVQLPPEWFRFGKKNASIKNA